MKLAKLFCCEPQQIQGRVQIPIHDQPTNQTVIGAMFERYPLLDMPTAPEQCLVQGNQREAMNSSPPALASLVLRNR